MSAIKTNVMQGWAVPCHNYLRGTNFY